MNFCTLACGEAGVIRDGDVMGKGFWPASGRGRRTGVALALVVAAALVPAAGAAGGLRWMACEPGWAAAAEAAGDGRPAAGAVGVCVMAGGPSDVRRAWWNGRLERLIGTRRQAGVVGPLTWSAVEMPWVEMPWLETPWVEASAGEAGIGGTMRRSGGPPGSPAAGGSLRCPVASATILVSDPLGSPGVGNKKPLVTG